MFADISTLKQRQAFIRLITMRVFRYFIKHRNVAKFCEWRIHCKCLIYFSVFVVVLLHVDVEDDKVIKRYPDMIDYRCIFSFD